MPDLSFDPQIYTPRALAVSIVAAALSSVAAQLDGRESTKGIKIEFNDRDSAAEVTLTARELPVQELEQIAAELNHHLGEESTVSLECAEGALRITFQVVRRSI